VVGNIHLFNLCLPLLRRSDAPKFVAVTTGMSDLDYLARHDGGVAGPYTIAKGALNVAVAKLAAQHRHERILTMAISPGVVATTGPPANRESCIFPFSPAPQSPHSLPLPFPLSPFLSLFSHHLLTPYPIPSPIPKPSESHHHPDPNRAQQRTNLYFQFLPSPS
jgi:hypothetical protein